MRIYFSENRCRNFVFNGLQCTNEVNFRTYIPMFYFTISTIYKALKRLAIIKIYMTTYFNHLYMNMIHKKISKINE